MARTPEQIAADEVLTAAIEQALTAYTDNKEPYVLTEYVVLTSQQRFDEEGDGITAVGVIYRDGDVPGHRALGLVEYAKARMLAYINSEEE